VHTYFWILLKTNSEEVQLGPYTEYSSAKMIINEHYEILGLLINGPLVVLSIEERMYEKEWITITTKLEVQFDNNELVRAIC